MNDTDRFFAHAPHTPPTFQQLLAEWAGLLENWTDDVTNCRVAWVTFTPSEHLKQEMVRQLTIAPAPVQEIQRLVAECRDAHTSYMGLDPIPLEALDNDEERDEVHEANQQRERAAVAGLEHAIRELWITVRTLAQVQQKASPEDELSDEIRAAAKFIREHPGNKGDVVAREAGYDDASAFRRAFGKYLVPLGYYSKSGYRPPPA